jgi:hypothetical protein
LPLQQEGVIKRNAIGDQQLAQVKKKMARMGKMKKMPMGTTPFHCWESEMCVYRNVLKGAPLSKKD